MFAPPEYKASDNLKPVRSVLTHTASSTIYIEQKRFLYPIHELGLKESSRGFSAFDKWFCGLCSKAVISLNFDGAKNIFQIGFHFSNSIANWKIHREKEGKVGKRDGEIP